MDFKDIALALIGLIAGYYAISHYAKTGKTY